MKIFTYENIKNTEANKLFEDLGYELVQDNREVSYKKIDKIYTWASDEIIFFEWGEELEINVAHIELGRPRGSLNILPLIYPITKLCEELNIDIEKAYLESKENKDEDIK